MKKNMENRKEKDKLFNTNLGLAEYIAKIYAKKHSSLQQRFGDLRQYARIGLWNACRNFDRKKGKFEPYAKECIRRHILKSIIKENQGIHIPDRIATKIKRIKNFIKQFFTRYRRNPSIEEISLSTGFPEVEVEELLDIDKYSWKLASLDGITEKRGDFLAKPVILEKDISSHQKELGDIKSIVNSWPEDDAKIIKMRFGLEDDRKHSRNKIAKKLNLHVDKIRRIEEKRLKELENRLGPDFKKRFFR